jgi:hypothetical protein
VSHIPAVPALLAAFLAPKNGAKKMALQNSILHSSVCNDFLIFGLQATGRRSTSWRTSVPALFYADLATWQLQAVREKA